MKVEKWISYREAQDLPEAPIGGLGGWFNWREKGQRWQDYLDDWNEEVYPYLEAFRESVLELQIRFCGDYHQSGRDGVPLFDDGTVATFSYRGWGDIMAAIWSEEDGIDYNYMAFYM